MAENANTEQEKFLDAVIESPEMTVEQKLRWAKVCADDYYERLQVAESANATLTRERDRLTRQLDEARAALDCWPRRDYDPPFDGKPCPMCPLEIRNLAATAHNLTVAEYGTERFLHKLQELRRAVEMVKPLADAHFVDESHAHRPITQWSAAATEEKAE